MRFFTFLLLNLSLLIGAQNNFETAEKLMKQGKFAQAKTLLEDVIKENPNHIKALEYLGHIEGYDKSWDKALRYFGKLKQLNPKEADYCYKYGGCLAFKAKESNKFKALGMVGEIKDNFEKAIQLDSKHIGARWGLLELYLQLPGIFGGSEKKAQRYANELLLISPVDGYLAKGRINVYFERYKEAEKNYTRAHAIGNSKVTCQKLADLYKNKLNQPQKAKLVLDKFSEKNKT